MEETPETVRGAAPEGAGIDVHEYLRIVYQRRRLALAVFATFLLLALLKTVTTRPTYQTGALLDIEKEMPGATDFGSTSAAYAWVWDPEFYQTQYDLLKSRGLAERVVTRLHLADRPELNPARASYWKGRGAASGVPLPDGALAGLAMRVQGMTSVVPTRGTHLVTVLVEAPSGQLAADVANGLAESFIDWNLERKYRRAVEDTRFLAMEAEQLKAELDSTKQKLAAYGASSNIVSSDPQGNLTMQKLESISKDYGSALADRIAKEAKYNEVRTAPPEAIADTLSNGLVTQLRAEQAREEREYAQKLNVFKPEWPAMQQLAAQIDKGREHLLSVVSETVRKARETARADYDAALQREQSLLAVLSSQKRQAVAQSSASSEYNNLRTEVAAKQTLLDSLMKRQSETSIDSQLSRSRDSNVRIVDRAIAPTSRFRPRYSRNLALGGCLGLALGLGLIFLLDHLDRSLKSSEDVQHWVRVPTLGIIPAVEPAAAKLSAYGSGPGARSRASSGSTRAPDLPAPVRVELIPEDRPRSAAAEAYRALRTSLLLSSAERLQAIVVTSPVPGEGKTATAINLSVVLSQLGKTVLLVDADLRKPRIHEVFRLSKRTGLVSCLTGQICLDEAIQKTALPGLSLLASGPTPPNPSELLASSRMAALLEEARARFDFIVIDTPPVLPVTDAVVSGRLADGVVVCVYGGKTPRDLVQKTRDRLRQAGVGVFGVLLNNLSPRLAAASYYGKSGYAREYPAGYGDEKESSRTMPDARGTSA